MEASRKIPYSSEDVKPKPSGSKSDLNTIFSFIQLAYEGLEHSDIKSAYENYSLAFFSYSRANLNIISKIKANFELNTLYEKLPKFEKTKHLYT